MKKRMLILFIVLLLSLSLFTGCTISEKPTNSQNSQSTGNAENNQNADETDSIPLPPQLPEE
jgi:outer membrane protein assembly factor BamE (lipoprotein component of BamABCDE complex)